MRKQDKLFILKYFLNILNAIFMVLGFMFLAFGLWISFNRNRFFILLCGHSPVTSISHMLLAMGSIIVLIGLLGCLGSLHEIRCLVVAVNNLWEVQMDELISTYGNKKLTEKKHQWDILDDFQHMMHCCGRYNATDWKWNEHKEHVNQVPCSCTTSNMKRWCYDVLKNATYTMVLQFVAAAWLFRIMKKNAVLPSDY